MMAEGTSAEVSEKRRRKKRKLDVAESGSVDLAPVERPDAQRQEPAGPELQAGVAPDGAALPQLLVGLEIAPPAAEALEDVEPPPHELSALEEEIEQVTAEDLSLEDLDAVFEGSNDPVRMYLREIGQVPLLVSEDEVTLAQAILDGKTAKKRLAANGDLPPESSADYQAQVERGYGATRRLAEANLRLVVSVAKRYMGRGMSLLDLIQEGNIGLLRAVDKFDHTKGYKFSTYATWWIRQSISRAIADQARTIRIPVHMVETINHLLRIQRRLQQELGRDPTPEDVALDSEMNLLEEEERETILAALAEGERVDPMLSRKLRRAAKRVQQILRISQEPMSLETPVGSEEDSLLGDFIKDETALGPDDAASKQLLREQMRTILGSLNRRERQVLEMRFGLKDGQGHTLEEVGQAFGVTRERIRQIEAKALRKLRHPIRSRKLRDYLA